MLHAIASRLHLLLFIKLPQVRGKDSASVTLFFLGHALSKCTSNAGVKCAASVYPVNERKSGVKQTEQFEEYLKNKICENQYVILKIAKKWLYSLFLNSARYLLVSQSYTTFCSSFCFFKFYFCYPFEQTNGDAVLWRQQTLS